jgi:PD-(D/E)XK endonuclease
MRGDRTKEKGSVGELRVMYEASLRGYGVLTPHGDFARYDLVVDRKGRLERVQVKSVTPVDGVISVHTKTMSFDSSQDINNRSKITKYKTGDFDWLAVYDLTNHNVYFVPAAEVVGRSSLALRIEEPKRNLQTVRMASEYTVW